MDFMGILTLVFGISICFYLLNKTLNTILKAVHKNNELLSETKIELEILNRRLDK